MYVSIAVNSEACSMEAPRCGRTLMVFDFDWSLINENSDTWVLKELRPRLLDELRQGQRKGLGWTELMDSMFGRLHDLKVSRQVGVVRKSLVEGGMKCI